MDFDSQEKSNKNLQLFISNLDFNNETDVLRHGKISESEIDCDLSEVDFEYAERQRSLTMDQFDQIFKDLGINESEHFFINKVGRVLLFL